MTEIRKIRNRADFARYAAPEAVQAHLDAARRRATEAIRDVEWLENLLAVKLDRRHAGLELPCEVCDGPCRIDAQPEAGGDPLGLNADQRTRSDIAAFVDRGKKQRRDAADQDITDTPSNPSGGGDRRG